MDDTSQRLRHLFKVLHQISPRIPWTIVKGCSPLHDLVGWKTNLDWGLDWLVGLFEGNRRNQILIQKTLIKLSLFFSSFFFFWFFLAFFGPSKTLLKFCFIRSLIYFWLIFSSDFKFLRFFGRLGLSSKFNPLSYD